MIYNFISGNDFIIGGSENLFYFLINLILSCIISITGLVYNEFIVLFFCGLERNTYKEITKRSKIVNETMQLIDTADDNDTEKEDDNIDTYTVYA